MSSTKIQGSSVRPSSSVIFGAETMPRQDFLFAIREIVIYTAPHKFIQISQKKGGVPAFRRGSAAGATGRGNDNSNTEVYH
jgi:hypothetical protein